MKIIDLITTRNKKLMIENIRINADKYGKTREHVSLFLILVICLLPSLYTSINAIPVTDIMDEVSMLKIPAFLQV